MIDPDGQRLIFLFLIGGALVAYLLAGRLRGASATVRQSAVLGPLLVAAVAAFALWSDIRSAPAPGQMIHDGGPVEVRRARDGYFYLTLEVQGTPVEFVVDTGASDIVLTRADAARVGIDTGSLRFYGSASTANGEVPIAPIWLDRVRLGGIVDRNLRASVNGGELFNSLLGMSYLDRFERIEIARDRLILRR